MPSSCSLVPLVVPRSHRLLSKPDIPLMSTLLFPLAIPQPQRLFLVAPGALGYSSSSEVLLSLQLSHGSVPFLPLQPVLQPQQLVPASSGCCLSQAHLSHFPFLFPNISAFPHPLRFSSDSWHLLKWLVWQALTQVACLAGSYPPNLFAFSF